MPRKPLAFLTMDCLAGFVAYDELAKPPLAERGWTVCDVSWKDPAARWDDFAAVIVRSPWDYHTDSAAFLQVVEAIDHSSARLLNPADTIRWNINKTYLRDLQQQGLPIVPTQWLHSPRDADLQRAASHFSVDELVLKPTLGAGARDTYRLSRQVPLSPEVVSLYHDRDAMLQPFLSSVVEQGEWSLFYFGDAYSHTVLKTPAAGDYRVQEEYGSRLQAVEPTADLRRLGDATMQVVRSLVPPTLYARVDVVRLADQTPAIIELELIEPSLYFPYDEASPQRFAEAVDKALR
ncbi:MAG: ATP-grasp domain-containing protein [Planctomycetaceae bacterium]